MHFAPALESFLPVRDLAAPGPVVAQESGDDPLALPRRLLRGLMAASDVIGRLPLARSEGGYARTFLLGDETLTAWALTWAPGAETSIHDHHCSCCFGVVGGTIVERWFSSIGGDRVVKTAEAARAAGFSACMLPTGPNIHQVINVSGREAISIHVYGFDRERHASSVEREYRLASL